MSHALVRTSPKGKGQQFIGKCAKCGITGLTLKQANEPCVNPAGLDWGESFALTMRILDAKEPAR